MKANAHLDLQLETGVLYEPSSDGQEHPLLGEDSFQQVLALERKRSERSGNPVLLMLLNLKDLGNHHASRNLLSHLSSALYAVTRETDIKGWYANHLILGVIYTEIGNTDLQEARDTIYRKVDECLRDILTGEQRQQVEISFDAFLGNEPQQLAESVLTDFRFSRSKASTGVAAASPMHCFTSFLRHRGVLMVGDVMLVGLACFLSAWIRVGAPFNIFAEAPVAYSATLCLVLASLFIFDQYNALHLSRWRETLTRTALAVCLAALCSAAISFYVPQWQSGFPLYALEAGLVWVFLATFRVVYARLFVPAEARMPALVLGNGNLGKNVCQLLSTPFSPYDVQGCLVDGHSGESDESRKLGILGSLDQIGETAGTLGIRTLIVALPRHRSQHIVRRILEARLNGMEIIDMPDLYERLTGRVPLQYIEDQWLLFADGFSLLSRVAVQRVKRLIDLIFSSLVLLITLPAAAIIALAIRLDSSGPVFYQEERIGKSGHHFYVWNFRSLCSHAGENGNSSARQGDPRATRVGRWLRLLRIDQLPQIWNVFKGDMSLVGPSPERPELARELNRQIPYYSVRHTVPPGITGWAHIKYPYGASFEDALRRLEYDLYYIKNMSIFLDLKILFRTIGMALLGEAPR